MGGLPVRGNRIRPRFPEIFSVREPVTRAIQGLPLRGPSHATPPGRRSTVKTRHVTGFSLVLIPFSAHACTSDPS